MAKLTAKTRNALPAKDFAGPDRSFPINNPSHARNALARVANKSPELKAKIKAKVHRKYPGIKVSGEGEKSKERHDRPERRSGGALKRADGGSTPQLTPAQIKMALSGALGGFGGGLGDASPPPYSGPPITPVGPTGRESIKPDGTVSGFKRGGKVRMDAGAGSGVGRLEQAERCKGGRS